jgi:hypothetical protein
MGIDCYSFGSFAKKSVPLIIIIIILAKDVGDQKGTETPKGKGRRLH